MIQNAFDLYFNRPKPVELPVGEAAPEGMRTCIKCSKVLELGMFHRNGKHAKTGKPRWRVVCKDCYNDQVNRKARSKKWQAK